jgi:hypothetical protein
MAGRTVEPLLTPDAKQEQDDDQRERRAEQPEKDQDHRATSFLHPRRPVTRDRTTHTRPFAAVEAEVHTLA